MAPRVWRSLETWHLL